MQHNETPAVKSYIISVIKGIGIILVVLGHTGMPLTKYIYLFHMALFFLLSGYTLNKKYWQNMKNIGLYVKKKTKSLYIPYVVFGICLCLLNNLFIDIGFYTTDELAGAVGGSVRAYMDPLDMLIEISKILCFAGNVELAGAMWYLRALFFADIIYVLLRYVVSKVVLENKARMVISSAMVLIFLMIGYKLNMNKMLVFYNISALFSVTILLHIGNVLREYDVITWLRTHLTSLRRKLTALGTVAGLLIILNNFEAINIGTNRYNHPITYLVASFVGSLGIWLLAYLIVGRCKKAARVLAYISEFSIWIIALHFVGMRIGNYLIVTLGSEPVYMIAAHPVISSNYWPLYTILGVGFPMLARKGLIGTFRLISKG